MYIKGPVETYLNDLAAKKPAPGGGSAAALEAGSTMTAPWHGVWGVPWRRASGTYSSQKRSS